MPSSSREKSNFYLRDLNISFVFDDLQFTNRNWDVNFMQGCGGAGLVEPFVKIQTRSPKLFVKMTTISPNHLLAYQSELHSA